MRYALCAFPLVGGGDRWIVLAVGGTLSVGGRAGPSARAVRLLPAAVTGGIHLDGYCDTVDALASHGTPARRQKV